MTDYEVMILPLAEDDIMAHADYIACQLNNPETALRIANGLRKTIHKLCTFPQSHRINEDDELRKYKVRNTYYKSYNIYFLIDEIRKIVFILRVFHMLVDSRERVLSFFKEQYK